MSTADNIPNFAKRRLFVLAVLLVALALLAWRAVYLQVLSKDFLQYQGDARSLRVVSIPAHRGMITDRHGEPLAISTPVDSVWVNPQEFSPTNANLAVLSKMLRLDPDGLRRLLAERSDREFVYIKRQINPDLAQEVMALKLPGVALQREYRRYYPAGEVAAHVVGFTDVDDNGQEGVELAYNDWLRGTPGSKRVLKDRLGRIVEDVESIEPSRPGKDLQLSLDRRLQYLAYRELKAAVLEHNARAGSAVLLDAKTGEVLAMVNQPSYNSNNRSQLRGDHYRNRAVTDVFEPGSTIKPFTIAAALLSGKYRPDTPIDTTPGTIRIGRNTIRDVHNCGLIDVSHVIIESSNVGATKIALSLPSESLWNVFKAVGFGMASASGFPGEAAGILTNYHRWGEIEQATMSFGYGISVTALQLAHAYTILARDGVSVPVSFLRVRDAPAGQRVLPARVTEEIRRMLAGVVTSEGTGFRAEVPGYRVAGKTGTVHKSVAGGYAANRYLALFAGMAPAKDPRLVLVVIINEPRGEYYGGQVAAPVFSRIMAGALRLLDVPPDNVPLLQTKAEAAGGRT